MNTNFFNQLVLGRKYEEKAASLLEAKDYQVLRIGNWKVPIDLIAWNDNLTFLVEVKYRKDKLTKKEKVKAMGKVDKFMEGENIPVLLFSFYEGGIDTMQIYPPPNRTRRNHAFF